MFTKKVLHAVAQGNRMFFLTNLAALELQRAKLLLLWRERSSCRRGGFLQWWDGCFSEEQQLCLNPLFTLVTVRTSQTVVLCHCLIHFHIPSCNNSCPSLAKPQFLISGTMKLSFAYSLTRLQPAAAAAYSSGYLLWI